jgi:hypothetical protein
MGQPIGKKTPWKPDMIGGKTLTRILLKQVVRVGMGLARVRVQ